MSDALEGSAYGGVVDSECVANDQLEASGRIEAKTDQQLVHWRQAVTALRWVLQLVFNLHFH